jgi:hypothetical protein
MLNNRLFVLGLGIGIIFSTVILYLLQTQQQTASANPAPALPEQNVNEQDMIHALQEKGYVVLSKEAYVRLEKKGSEVINTAPQKHSPSAKLPETATLIISPGMTSMQVEKLLEQANILPANSGFSKYMVSVGKENRIQVGAYRLHTGMTVEEVARLIAK